MLLACTLINIQGIIIVITITLLTQACHVGETATSNDSPLSPQPLALYLVSKMLAILSYSYKAQCRSLALRRLLDITSRFALVFTQQLS